MTIVAEKNIEVIKFWAPWCKPCQDMKIIMDKIIEKYKFKFTDINIDENTYAAVDYKIRSIPTIIILKDKNIIDRISGVKTLKDLEIIFDNL